MKRILISFFAFVTLAQAQSQNVVEASAAQAAAGTVGLPYVITPRRQGGGSGAPGTVTSITGNPSSTATIDVTNPTTDVGITVNALGVTPPASGNALISGGGIEFTSGLNFTVGGATYLIQGVQYTSPITNLSASAADPTDPRTDVVVVDTSGVASIITGTPGNPTLTPQYDPATQLYLTSYTLTANATVLPGTINTIYEEDAGPSAEWTATKSGTPIVLNSTNNPYRGTKDIEGTAVVAGNSITFMAPATFDPATYSSDIFYVAPKAAWPKAKQFSIQLLDASGNPLGSIVTFKNGSFGFNSSGTANAYQQISIPMTLFAANGQTVQGMKLTLTGGGGSIGFYMDSFSLQAGLAPLPPSNAMVFRGDYASTTNYVVNDVVTFQNTSYIAIAPSVAQVPPTYPATSTFWKQMVNASFTGITSVLGTANEVGVSTTSGVATASLPSALTFTGKTVTGGTYSGALLSDITTQTGTTVTTPAAGTSSIDVTQRESTSTTATDVTFSFSGTPANDGQWFGRHVTNTDSAAHTATFPTSVVVNGGVGGTTTTATLPANSTTFLNWQYIGGNFELHSGGGGGVPGGSSGDYQYNNAGAFGGKTPGTGVDTAFQNATNATGGFLTFSGAFGTPTSLTLTNATGLPVAGGGTGATTAAGANVNLTPAPGALGNLTGTINIDWSTSNTFYGTLTGNTTFTFSNATAGQNITVNVAQTGTNTFTVTWPSAKWTGGAAPTMTTGAATSDVTTIIYANSVYWGSSVQNLK